MKNIVKYCGLLFLALFVATSCEDATVGDDQEINYNTHTSVVTFPAASVNATAVASGDPVPYIAKIGIQGPDVDILTADVAVSVSVDPASTAVQGTHFTLPNSTITLTADQDYLGSFPITIITDGITPPLTKTLILNIDEISTSADDVVISGNKNQVTITINYSCYADLTGTYSVTNDFCGSSGTTTITMNEDGSWHLGTADGFWLDQCTGNAGLLNAGNIMVVCGEVLPSTDLDYGSDSGSYSIGDITGGSWDPDTGTLILHNTDHFFNGGPYSWTSTYVRL
jgi:hypothetical protein